ILGVISTIVSPALSWTAVGLGAGGFLATLGIIAISGTFSKGNKAVLAKIFAIVALAIMAGLITSGVLSKLGYLPDNVLGWLAIGWPLGVSIALIPVIRQLNNEIKS